MTSQASIAAAGAAKVLTQASPASSLAPRAEPALKPNQPNHSNPAPSITKVRLCGRIGTLPKPTRGPSTIASASAAAPALMWIAVPPAKSKALMVFAMKPPRSATAPSKAKTQWAAGK